MGRQLRLTKFKYLSLQDPFFDSLKEGYSEFPVWFERKSEEDVYVVEDQTELSGFVYLKLEVGEVTDVEPALVDARWLKVGTLKITGRGTKLGERVIKKIFDTALDNQAEGIYVTVFEIHESLIELFKKYGFVEHGTKSTDNGVEIVLTRSLTVHDTDIIRRYPFISLKNNNQWLLAVYPEFHSQLLPDSILNNESRDIVQDVSHTNTIHKIYIGKLALTRMRKGDAIVIYRTTDRPGQAYYRSVATSICVVEEVKRKKDFPTVQAFLTYCQPRSVFPQNELQEMYANWDRLYTVKMTYNVAFNKRLTRGRLMEAAGVPEQPRWDLKPLSREAFNAIVEMGEINESLIID